jgi:hypothetical protein
VETPVPTVTGLTDETVTEGETVPGETFRLGGQGPFTVSVETTNAALLPPAYVRLSAGCGTKSEECTLELEPTAGETGTATVVVEAENGSGQVGVGTMVLTVETEAQAQASSTLGAPGGGGGSLGFVGLMGLGLAALVVGGRRRRVRRRI